MCTSADNGYKNTKLGIVPDSWKTYKLSNVLKLFIEPLDMDDDKEYELITVRRSGKIDSRGIYQGKNILVKTQFYIRENNFVISKRQVSHGAFGLVPANLDGAIVSNEYNVFKTDETKINTKFLRYYARHPKFWQSFYSYSDGIHIEKLLFKTTSWLKQRFPFPTLKEQEIIAQILSTWDEAIVKQEELIKEKEQLKKGLMQKLLSGEVRFDGFNDEWEEYTLGNIGKAFSGLSGKTAEDFGHGDDRYITYKSIFDSSEIDLNRLENVYIGTNENQNLVQFGDVFFTISSETPEEVGMSSVLLQEVKNTYLNSFCFGYRINNFNILEPSFARFYFRSFYMRDKLMRLAQGSTRFNLSKNKVLKLKVKLPSHVEQQKIAEVLSLVDNELTLLKNEFKELKLQKKGLMQQLLTGEVRVKV